MAAVCSLQGWREVLLCQNPSEIRSAGLSHLHRAQRRKQQGEQKGGGGGGEGRRGPKQTCPTTHFGRKQSSVGSVSAQETSCGKVREWRREGLLTDSSKTQTRKGRVETERKDGWERQRMECDNGGKKMKADSGNKRTKQRCKRRKERRTGRETDNKHELKCSSQSGTSWTALNSRSSDSFDCSCLFWDVTKYMKESLRASSGD